MKVTTGEAKLVILALILALGFFVIIPNQYSYLSFVIFFIIFFVLRKKLTFPVSQYFRLIHIRRNKWKLFKRNRSFFLFCTAPQYRIIRSLERDIEIALRNTAQRLSAGSFVTVETWLFREKFLQKYKNRHKNNQFLSEPIVKPLSPTLCLEAEASCFNDLSVSTGVSSGATNPTK